ncbi:MerR family transcriptional regulator [Secundilactobacillus paracollinoides]|uniref:MerR family transcriptional regulator n=1 Tax=Secundilactobacillus paracollinoides TaxID=240427 RepID=UPI0006D02461|nr:MerR family transcriptional regulator [Secundilactobacillus paracollinoides]KRL75667.1 merR regulatory family protein [Secundilactobacillus paracollinoides DSM 15502 = JCM 11969]
MAETIYKIGAFSKKVGLPNSTLRYYEDEGLIKPHYDDNGQRYYTDADIKWIGFILHLKGTGMRMGELKDYVTWRAQGDETIPQRVALLSRVKTNAEDEIKELEANLEVVRHKIDWYQGKLDATIDEDENFEHYLRRFQ